MDFCYRWVDFYGLWETFCRIFSTSVHYHAVNETAWIYPFVLAVVADRVGLRTSVVAVARAVREFGHLPRCQSVRSAASSARSIRTFYVHRRLSVG